MGTGRTWRIGELADAAGLTVRTLHHWDHLGLLSPSGRTTAGHRRYAEGDVERLYAVVALRQLGLPLASIAASLGGGLPIEELLARHAEHLDRQWVALRTLRAQVATARAEPGLSENDVLELIRKVIHMDETVAKYFDAEQQALLAERRAELGEAAIAEVEAAWPELMARVDEALARGVDPASDEAQTLAGEWSGLLERFHGGNEGLRRSLGTLQSENAERIEREFGGPSPAQLAFIGRACAARGD